MYAATRVLDAKRDGDGVELTVATDDPTGRELSVSVQPAPNGSIRVRASPTDPTGVAAMTDSFASGTDEAFHGFGGRHDAIVGLAAGLRPADAWQASVAAPVIDYTVAPRPARPCTTSSRSSTTG